MSRDFGLVKSSLWGSSRFRRLGSDTARLTYIYLHANDHGNAIGAYRLPIEYVSADMKCSAEEARKIIADLGAVDLIRYDAAESVVMICKWFDHNPIHNPKHLVGAVRAFQRLPSMTGFLPDLAAAIIASAWQQAQDLQAGGIERKRSLNAKSREFGERNLESAAQMIEQMVVLRDAVLSVPERLAGFVRAIETLPERLSASVSEGLSIPLSIHKRQETQTQTQTTDTDSNNRHKRENAAEAAVEFIQRGRAAG